MSEGHAKACSGKHRQVQRGSSFSPRLAGSALSLALIAGSATAISPAQAQAPWQPQSPQYIQCLPPGQPLIRIPEIVSDAGKLRGTLILNNGVQRLYLGGAARDTTQCLPQDVRQFRSPTAVLPAYAGAIPPGLPGYVPPTPAPPADVLDPVPGPTLRAKLGDIVELTFLNQIGTGPYWDSIDRGEKGQGCDESTAPYPGLDVFPDCFHGSSTGNIHFHGTHTNPNSTGDNVLIEVRPSLRVDDRPVVTEASVKASFDDFFGRCETELNKSVLSQWPRTWVDMPASFVASQLALLARYDANPTILNKLLPIDLAQLGAGAWPQYYIGAFPYCFRIPEYNGPWPPVGRPHPPGHSGTQRPALQMGQSPGTHWYHAHKHGSTTINVANGMTGAFIIEGGYDEMLNNFYKDGWTGQQPWARSQPVLVVNQLGVSPNLFGGGAGGGAPFVVNGRFQPVITMQPGQVQLWRIANTSSRGSVYMAGFGPANAAVPSSPQAFAWQQIAQDGVQFTGGNYAASKNPNLLISPGNRADVLIKAPTVPGQYVLLASQVRSRCETLALSPTIPTVAPAPPRAQQPPLPPYPTPICNVQTPSPFLFVQVTGTPATGNQALFIPPGQVNASFPPFLTDITDKEIKLSRTVEFESVPTGGNPGAKHMVDGQQFDGNVGQVVLLNTAEEWKIVNKTVNGDIKTVNGNPKVVTTDPPGVVDHPFHIHINPFQITEVFDPNEVLPGTNTYKYIFEGTTGPGQCFLDPNDPSSWKPSPCVKSETTTTTPTTTTTTLVTTTTPPSPSTGRVWWDVFPIPSARAVFLANNTQVKVVPGYFTMRSRFVDFAGQYVLHCHILAHEDRGMMTIVEVVPFTTAYSHK
jgi:FtsP/CotA-like multicopper oxidase with cupredoxin domain